MYTNYNLMLKINKFRILRKINIVCYNFYITDKQFAFLIQY